MDVEVVDGGLRQQGAVDGGAAPGAGPGPYLRAATTEPCELTPHELHGQRWSVDVHAERVGEGVGLGEQRQVGGTDVVDDELRLLTLALRVALEGEARIGDVQRSERRADEDGVLLHRQHHVTLVDRPGDPLVEGGIARVPRGRREQEGIGHVDGDAIDSKLLVGVQLDGHLVQHVGGQERFADVPVGGQQFGAHGGLGPRRARGYLTGEVGHFGLHAGVRHLVGGRHRGRGRRQARGRGRSRDAGQTTEDAHQQDHGRGAGRRSSHARSPTHGHMVQVCTPVVRKP